MRIVNIQKYGDWDAPYTVCSMVAPASMGKKQIGIITAEAEKKFANTSDTDELVRYLTNEGFATIGSSGIVVGGDL